MMTDLEIKEYIESKKELKKLKITSNEYHQVRIYLESLNNDKINKILKPELYRDENNELNCKLVRINKNIGLDNKELMNFAEDLDIQSSSISNAYLSYFRLDTKERENAVLVVKNFIKRILSKEKIEKKGLYIYGKNGVGKSYLASCIFNELKEKLNILYVYSSDLSRQLKLAPFDKVNKYVRVLKKVDLLIIDDFGSEDITTYYRDELLLPIIEYRTINNLPFVITSNSSIGNLVSQLSKNDGQMELLKSAKLVRRINDYTEKITF